jgi:site-specific recombinase XerD
MIPWALGEAGIEDFIWHCCRHTFASRLVMAGVDLRKVAELLGHRTLQMVMRTSHLAPEHQIDAVDRQVPTTDDRTAIKTATDRSERNEERDESP